MAPSSEHRRKTSDRRWRRPLHGWRIHSEHIRGWDVHGCRRNAAPPAIEEGLDRGGTAARQRAGAAEASRMDS